MSAKGAKILDARAVVFELEIAIDARPDRVWDAMVKETNGWWLADFHMMGKDSTVTLEPEAGGRFIERIAGGESLLWYTVQWCRPGKFLYLNSPIGHEFGGPAGTILKLALEEGQGDTVLKVTQEMYGHVSEDSMKNVSTGWTRLFTDGLKEYVEKGTVGVSGV